MQQQDSSAERCPPPYCTHTQRYSELCYWCTHTSHRDMQTHQTCQEVLRTDPKNKTGLVTRYTVNWLRSLPVLQGYPQKNTKRAARCGFANWQLMEEKYFGCNWKIMSVLSLIYVPLWPAINSHESFRCSSLAERSLVVCVFAAVFNSKIHRVTKKCRQFENKTELKQTMKENWESRAKLRSIDPIIILCPNRGKQETEKWNNICHVIWV